MEAASWRTAFVRLREEKQSIESLVQDLLLFSESPKLNISVGEVTSDVTFLLELLLKSVSPEEDGAHTCLHTLHLIHRFSQSLEFNSSSCPIVLDFLQHVLQCLSTTSNNNIQLQAVIQILDLLRNRYGTNYNNQLLHLLVHVVAIISNVPSSTLNNTIHLWDYQTIAFNMIADTVSTIGSSLSPQSWHSTLEVLRKVMDAMVSKTLLVQDSVMSRFYTSLLHCLHLLLSDPKGSLSEHVAGFVAALRMFFVYGLTNRSPLAGPDTSHKEEFSYQGRKSILAESTRPERGAYRPPHLRKREGKSMPRLKASNSQSLSDNEPYALGFTSSDSEHSDSDGFAKDVDNFRSSKTRLAAIICIQDLCQIDLKAVTAHLTMLLPTSDVLQPRKYEATLMTCLLFDPVVKARMASASTLAAMLSGPSPVFLQVAEYKESTKRGSFTALSSSLGQILMQLHTGILYLLQRESHNGLLATLFKVLMLLISATPYARMPEELLPSVISTLRSKMIDGFPSRTDQAGLLVSCM
ncbi:hypothetical protein IFM89_037847 [Coptis chinensis]|uniref:DUF4042 domain-containing protein n=1 Tax=Coptis chinensis TaxID=261450 RepID=A0A835LY52_9MAGN|nr:hypothetical protein IFM89_037847 [Coptis chinensis]